MVEWVIMGSAMGSLRLAHAPLCGPNYSSVVLYDLVLHAVRYQESIFFLPECVEVYIRV